MQGQGDTIGPKSQGEARRSVNQGAAGTWQTYGNTHGSKDNRAAEEMGEPGGAVGLGEPGVASGLEVQGEARGTMDQGSNAGTRERGAKVDLMNCIDPEGQGGGW